MAVEDKHAGEWMLVELVCHGISGPDSKSSRAGLLIKRLQSIFNIILLLGKTE
jgi:hypothetical protein